MMFRRTRDRALAVALLAGLAAGCTQHPSGLANACGQVHAYPALLATLFFGLRLPDGHIIPDTAWRSFMDESVTPRFPAGLTVLDADGQWTAPDGRLAREPSRVVMVATKLAPDTVSRLDTIRAEYRARFAQQSVGVVLSEACAAF